MRKKVQYYIASGPVIEIRRSWMSIDRDYKKPRGTRRVGASTEQKIRANEKGRIRTLARLLNCNYGAGDVHAVLKYDAAHYPSDLTYEQARENLKKFLTKLRKKYKAATGKSLKAVWITANWSPHRDAPAALHHHLVLPADAMQLAWNLWDSFGGAGTTKMETLDNRGDHTDLAAYLCANVKGRPSNENRWGCSRGMERPIIFGLEEIDDIEDVQPVYSSIVKDVEEIHDEEGRTVSKYMRCVLPERPKLRGGMVILPKRRKKRDGDKLG
jgi:hypothetical protein